MELSSVAKTGTGIASAVGIVAGVFIFIAAPATRETGQIEMVAWGIGLLLIIQGLHSITMSLEMN
jgi:hypothetical protein